MNYQSLKIEEKIIGLYFGLESAERIYNKTKRYNIEDLKNEEKKMSKSETIRLFRDILYSGYLNYCEVKEIIPEVTGEEVYLYIEANIDNETVLVELLEKIQFWTESQKIKANGEATEEEKKSLTI